MFAAVAMMTPVLAAEKEVSLAVGLGMLMVTLGLLTISMRMGRKSRPAKPKKDSPLQQASQIRQQQAVREEMEALFMQLSDLARQLNAQMDTRFAKLEQVIRDADEKIETLEDLMRKAAGVKPVDVVVDDEPAKSGSKSTRRKRGRATKQGASTSSSSSTPSKGKQAKSTSSKGGSGKRALAESAASAAGSKSKKDEQTAGKDTSSTAAGDEKGKPAAESAAGGAKADAGKGEPDPNEQRYRHIYSLADAGADPVEIARETGQTTGEVELILNLRKSGLG
jgi:hypothetical protein